MKTQSIIKGALILTTANIITRVLGFVYRVYMSNVIGAEGMGLYQLIVPIYMLVWSISSSGFTTTISKLTAQENAKKEYGNIGRILKQSMAASFLISVFLAVVVYIFSNNIAVSILKDSRAQVPLKVISLCFPFMAAGSCIRGCFLGMRQSNVPAASQVIEQLARMSVIFLLAKSFIPRGIEAAATAAILGTCAGEIISFLYVLFSYRLFKTKNRLNKKPVISPIKSLIMIMTMALPLTANRVTGSLLSTVENIMIPEKLKAYGMTSVEAISSYGQLTGMAMPLLMFPSSLLTAISVSLVPAVSEAIAKRNTSSISKTLTKSMLFTLITGIGTAGLFVTFSDEIGLMIYNEVEIGPLLFQMGFICPFLYCQVTLSGILNGLGEQMFIFRNSLISSAINIFFIFFLIPVYGIYAFTAGMFVSMMTVSLLAISKIITKTELAVDIVNSVIKPIICISASCLTARLIYNHLSVGIPNKIQTILAVIITGLFYCILLIETGCITKKDINMIIKRIPK